MRSRPDITPSKSDREVWKLFSVQADGNNGVDGVLMDDVFHHLECQYMSKQPW